MIVQYSHNNMAVSVVDEYKGKHKSICVCHQGCKNFKPDDPLNNCPIAKNAYALSVVAGIVLVMECKLFEVKDE